MSTTTPEREETLAPVEHPKRNEKPSTRTCHIFGPKILWYHGSTLCGEASDFGVQREFAQDVGGYCLHCGRRRCKRCLETAGP